MNMKQKVGPLPVWAWFGAVGLGVVIYYWRKNTSGVSVPAAAMAQPQALLDPTQGAFPMPPAISSGGAGPQVVTQWPTVGEQLGNISDLAGGLAGLYATLPFAPAPGQPQEATSGTTNVMDTIGVIEALRNAGLIAPPPTSAGSATSQAQSHKTPASAAKRVNNQARNPRKGQVYKVVTNPRGRPKGTYHVYNWKKGGKPPKYVRVKK